MHSTIKKIIPPPLFHVLQPVYHWLLSVLAPLVYGNPSEKLIVVGVTGTKGKSTTCFLVKKILEESGNKVGISSGIVFGDGKKEWLNDLKMTMPGRFYIQKLMRNMVTNGCTYAIIETTSEGIKQFRHRAINYDTVVFTNLHPEHIESHGSYEQYRETKEKLFAHLTRKQHKTRDGKRFEKKIIVNIDDEYARFFLKYQADKKYGYGVTGKKVVRENEIETITADNMVFGSHGSSFDIRGQKVTLNLLGKINVYNALAAIAISYAHGAEMDIIQNAFKKITNIPGRIEQVDVGQKFNVIVDYAHEPESFRQLYSIIKEVYGASRVIHVFGATGGGRDTKKRPEMGTIAAKYAQTIILTNDDPYDDDPEKIIEDIAHGIPEEKTLIKITDRREAIRKAVTIAENSDIVLVTGKGSEQAIVLSDGMHDWDDREVVKEEIKKLQDGVTMKNNT